MSWSHWKCRAKAKHQHKLLPNGSLLIFAYQTKVKQGTETFQHSIQRAVSEIRNINPQPLSPCQRILILMQHTHSHTIF